MCAEGSLSGKGGRERYSHHLQFFVCTTGSVLKALPPPIPLSLQHTIFVHAHTYVPYFCLELWLPDSQQAHRH